MRARPGRRPLQRISDRDRALAIEELTVARERGFITDDEFAGRVEIVQHAQTAEAIRPVLADLRPARRAPDDVRARDDERTAAERRLNLHYEAGQLDPDERDRRLRLVASAKTSG